MPRRKAPFIPGEHYHIYGRGVAKQNLFLDIRDRIRFLFLILYFQSPVSVHNIGSVVSGFLKKGKFKISKRAKGNILKNRKVALVSFALMPNHYHLVVEEIEAGGISKYMQKVLTAYGKYFSVKYKKSGHVFQGQFQAVHITSNRQLLHVSAYIHRNPRELQKWRNKEANYPWSSYQDCVGENRWGELLKTDIITGQFKKKGYLTFVKTSGAKL